MKIQEADAKSLLVAQGLPVPAWEVAHTVEQARAAAQRFLAAGADKVVIKAQVLVGGRGKAGGVKLAGSLDEAARVAGAIIGMDIKGITVRKVLIGPAANIVKEFYLAAVLDRADRRILLMGSAEGGVEIEVVAAEHPEAIIRRHADPLLGLLDYQARDLAFAMGLGKHLKAAVAIAKGLVTTMKAYDADLVEINPLAIVREIGPDGASVERLVCLDAKVTLDDSALARHPGLEDLRDPDDEAPADREAREAGLTFIKLDGTIGCMVNGAGLAMTTMDLVKRYGGEPANFLDIGGGAEADKVTTAMRHHPRRPAGRRPSSSTSSAASPAATRWHAASSRPAPSRRRDVPMVVRIVGTNEDEAARTAPRPATVDGRDLARRCRGRPSPRPPRERRREHPRRTRHTAPRPGHHRPRGRVPRPSDAWPYGTRIVAGVTPGKGGQTALDGTCRSSTPSPRRSARPAPTRRASSCRRPGAPDAIMEAADAGIRRSSASPRASRRST